MEICCPAGRFSGDEPAGGWDLGLEFRAGMECGIAFHDLIMHGEDENQGLDSRENGRVVNVFAPSRPVFRLSA